MRSDDAAGTPHADDAAAAHVDGGTPADANRATPANAGAHDRALRPSQARTSDVTAPEAVVSLVMPPTPSAATDVAPANAPAPVVPDVVDVEDLDWDTVRAAADPAAVLARAADILDRFEALLDRDGGPGMLFDEHRERPDDRAIRIAALDPATPLWIVGDLHGDLLTLEAALALARRDGEAPRLLFLGDFWDDGAYGLEVVLRVMELAADDPASVCVIAGNHDEALGWSGERFTATVSPSDFADRLNAAVPADDADPAADPAAEAARDAVRAGRLAIRFFANAPRALFFPDGLLVSHGGFPLVDLHPAIEASGDWNDPRALVDFVWTRAHPKARRKMPNRASRGSQFGHEDFADFCALAARLGRPVTHLARGHDHVDDRWAVFPAYARHPVLTTVALSRRLAREPFGPYVRVPTVARWVAGAVPQVHRLHLPEATIRALYPEELEDEFPDAEPAA